MAKMLKGKRTKDEVVGDTMLDIGKLIFGGIVLAGIFNSEFNKLVVVLGGVLSSTLLILGGIYYVTKK
jgi:hypothetical protein